MNEPLLNTATWISLTNVMLNKEAHYQREHSSESDKPSSNRKWDSGYP